MFRFLKTIFGKNHTAEASPEIGEARQITKDPEPKTWQERVAAIQLPPDERIAISVKSSNIQILQLPDEAALVSIAVIASGFSKGRDEDIRFYLMALKGGNLNGRDVRKIGRQLSKDEKTKIGLNFRGILTEEFISTLNDNGLSDPEHAAWAISSHASRLVFSASDLRDKARAGITQVKFRFGGMAAGHCSYSRKMDGHVVAIADAPALPSSECEHPDQCGCRWQSYIKMLDDIQ
ncbi:hypothetical protein [Sphingobium yanoikuyae]|uniref:hypothetical protein n=1 Tax=Sphingobium yanoikuyae TaxID=13690 RepID=UPI0026F17E66|nr:hypothetical protein [Sphingobium yanoikuyae]